MACLSRRGSSPLTRGKRDDPLACFGQRGLIPAHAGKTPQNQARRRKMAAHPRSRGENLSACVHLRFGWGSSPLTRGKRAACAAALDEGRLIPAHAGKTATTVRQYGERPAHPRSRGENFVGPAPRINATGSSPLTRGKHFLTCAFTAQIDQILETLELAVSSGSYSIWVACATDAPQDQVRSIGLVLPSSRGAS